MGDKTITPGTVFVWCLLGALAVLLVVLAARAMYEVQTLLVQILIATFIALSLDPFVRWMIARGIKRPFAVAIIMTVTVAAVVGIVWASASSLAAQANALTTDFPGYLDRLRERSPALSGLEERLGLSGRVDSWVRDLPEQIGAQALGFGRQFFGAVLSVLLVLVLTVYLLVDLPRIRRGLVRLFPMRHRLRAVEVINLVTDKVGSYMIGNLVISAIAGVTAFIVLAALGVPFALPLALLVAATDLIPLVGATIGAVVCLVVSAATSELWPTTVLVGLFFLVYQQIENYVIAPRVMRSSVNISSIAVLLAALIGASAMGVVGAVMAVPVAATIKVILSDRLRARDDWADDGANAVKQGSVAGPPVAVEVLLLSEQDEQLRYRSTSAPLDSAAPDDLAAALAALDDPDGVVHSTSWRFAGDGIVLTYIALPDPEPDHPTRAVRLGQVVSSGDPQEPDPVPTSTAWPLTPAGISPLWPRAIRRSPKRSIGIAASRISSGGSRPPWRGSSRNPGPPEPAERSVT